MNGFLKKHPGLRKIIKTIQRNPIISLAVFFGSYAKGTVRENSDIDAFIETEDRKLEIVLKALTSYSAVRIRHVIKPRARAIPKIWTDIIVIYKYNYVLFESQSS